MTYTQKTRSMGRISNIDNIGTTLKAKRNSPEHHAVVLDRLRQLTPCELEVCVLHLLEGHCQTTVAEWLGITLRVLQRRISHAVLKVPELRPLLTRSKEKTQQPRILQLSQLRGYEKGPFNADEL